MRPSCPPPRSPSVAPGRITALRVAAAPVDATSEHIRQLHRRDLLAHLLAILGELCRERRLGNGEEAYREEPRVGGPGLADREGRDRNALRHLHDRIERILSREMA